MKRKIRSGPARQGALQGVADRLAQWPARGAVRWTVSAGPGGFTEALPGLHTARFGADAGLPGVAADRPSTRFVAMP
jgi:hypothetical protein